MLRWCWCRWWWWRSSTWEVAVFSSAAVSCVCLEPRSSGACRSNDTTTATGILAPRVEIRHFLCLSDVFFFFFCFLIIAAKTTDCSICIFFFLHRRGEQSEQGGQGRERIQTQATHHRPAASRSIKLMREENQGRGMERDK